MREITHRRAAVLFADGDAEQAECAELAPQVSGKFIGAVDIGRARRDLARGEGAHGVAQHVGVFAEIEGQGRNVDHGVTHPVASCVFAPRAALARKNLAALRFEYRDLAQHLVYIGALALELLAPFGERGEELRQLRLLVPGRIV